MGPGTAWHDCDYVLGLKGAAPETASAGFDVRSHCRRLLTKATPLTIEETEDAYLRLMLDQAVEGAPKTPELARALHSLAQLKKASPSVVEDSQGLKGLIAALRRAKEAG